MCARANWLSPKDPEMEKICAMNRSLLSRASNAALEKNNWLLYDRMMARGVAPFASAKLIG